MGRRVFRLCRSPLVSGPRFAILVTVVLSPHRCRVAVLAPPPGKEGCSGRVGPVVAFDHVARHHLHRNIRERVGACPRPSPEQTHHDRRDEQKDNHDPNNDAGLCARRERGPTPRSVAVSVRNMDVQARDTHEESLWRRTTGAMLEMGRWWMAVRMARSADQRPKARQQCRAVLCCALPPVHESTYDALTRCTKVLYCTVLYCVLGRHSHASATGPDKDKWIQVGSGCIRIRRGQNVSQRGLAHGLFHSSSQKENRNANTASLAI